MFLFSLGKYQEVEWLIHTVGTCLTFKETAKLFSKVVAPFYTPIISVREFQLLHILINTWYDLFLKFLDNLMGV